MNEAEMGNTTYTGNALMLQPGHYAYCIMDGQMLDEYMETGVDIVNIVSPGNPFGGIQMKLSGQLLNIMKELLQLTL